MEIFETGSNYTIVLFNNENKGVYVLFSYKTPVAYNDVNGFNVTEQYFSSTTTKHINKFLNGANYKIVKQEKIDNITSVKAWSPFK